MIDNSESTVWKGMKVVLTVATMAPREDVLSSSGYCAKNDGIDVTGPILPVHANLVDTMSAGVTAFRAHQYPFRKGSLEIEVLALYSRACNMKLWLTSDRCEATN